MAARTGNTVLDLLLAVGAYYVFTHPSTGLDAEAALAYQEGVLVPSRKSKDIAKLQQLLKTAQATGQTAAATTIQAYLQKLQGGAVGGGSSGGPPGGLGHHKSPLGNSTHRTTPRRSPNGQTLGRYGVPIAAPAKLPLTGSNGVPLGYELYVADSPAAWYYLDLRLGIRLPLAIWRPPATLPHQATSVVYLGLGHAYFPAHAGGLPATRSPFYGIAEYRESGGVWRIVKKFAQLRTARANAIISGLDYVRHDTSPGGVAFV